MVKYVILEGEKLLRRKEAHPYLAQMLDFPDYYGKNLDALFDCLTQLNGYSVVLENGEILRQSGGYGAKLLEVFKEAAEANPRLKLEIREASGKAEK